VIPSFVRDIITWIRRSGGKTKLLVSSITGASSKMRFGFVINSSGRMDQLKDACQGYEQFKKI
jgi:hypothetical protein